MERRSTKHGPLRDQQMAHETEGMVRGALQPSHIEEWRQTEPVEDATVRRDPDTSPASANEDIELRSELARLLTRDVFPVDRAGLLGVLDGRGASDALVERVARIPVHQRFRSAHEVMLELGINAPEERAGE
ncbi:MAG TPA: DUF2795 domain-containing protein [Streptosporangiaceae bacterium]|jgi:hypothetical protein|nr:DUF2795 domain-containing protein [Streptosporangiaceae bacterium]